MIAIQHRTASQSLWARINEMRFVDCILHRYQSTDRLMNDPSCCQTVPSVPPFLFGFIPSNNVSKCIMSSQTNSFEGGDMLVVVLYRFHSCF